MVVLQLIPELSAGGAERTTLEVAEAIAATGGRALVVSEGGRLEGALKAVGGELIGLPVKSKNPWTIRRNAGRLARIIRKEGVDIVHARSRAPAWSGYWAAKRTGAVFITTYHGTYRARSPLKRWYNSVMVKGAAVIANSTSIAELIAREHGVDPARITTIYRGVDLDAFDPAAVSQARIAAQRAAWDIPEGAAAALLPARITHWKGQALAIEALARLGEGHGLKPILVCLGDAQGRAAYLSRLKTQAAEVGVGDQVRFPGHGDDMPAAYAAADIVLNPSTQAEAFGRTAAEAQAMGKPVIVADHGGAREVVDPEVFGWRFRPGDAEALSQAMAAALTLSPEARASGGAAARARIAARFSKSALQEATLTVYRKALECRL